MIVVPAHVFRNVVPVLTAQLSGRRKPLPVRSYFMRYFSFPDLAPWGRGESALLALGLFLFFWRLGGISIIDYDEALYVTCAQQMTLNNDFVTPRLNTRLLARPDTTQIAFFEKPIFVYWASAASMRAFGRNPFAARLPVALAALLTTLAVAGAGRRWFRRRAGLLAGMVYATAPMTVVDARQMTTDGLLVLWFTLALLAFWRLYRAHAPAAPDKNVSPSASFPLLFPSSPLLPVLLFWLMCAFAVLTKGIVGLLLPFLVIGVFLLDVRRASGRMLGLPLRLQTRSLRDVWPVLRGLKPLPGLVLFFAVVAPWHMQIAQRHERDSQNRTWVQEYIVRQHIGRFKGLDKVHNSPPYTYFAYFLIGYFPWSCFAPAAFRQKKEDESNHGEQGEHGENAESANFNSEPGTGNSELPLPEHPNARTPEYLPQPEAHRFLLVWFWAIFVFFSVGAAKLPTYITPAYPAAALLIGRWLDRVINRVPPAETTDSAIAEGSTDLPLRSLRRGAAAASVTGLLLLAAAFIGPRFAPARAPIDPAIARAAQHLGLLLTAGPFAALLCFLRRSANTQARKQGVGALAITMTLLAGLLCTEGYTVTERFVLGPYQQLARLARADAERGIPIVYYNIVPRRPSMNFYAGYAPIETKDGPLLPALRPFVNAAHPDVDILTTRDTFARQLMPEIEAAPGVTVKTLAARGPHDDWMLVRVHTPL